MLAINYFLRLSRKLNRISPYFSIFGIFIYCNSRQSLKLFAPHFVLSLLLSVICSYHYSTLKHVFVDAIVEVANCFKCILAGSSFS